MTQENQPVINQKTMEEHGFTPVPYKETIYRGMTDLSVAGGQRTVFKCTRNKTEIFSPNPSQKLWNHSPDGFQWGYAGSGPAQLALALLYDVTGDAGVSIRLHQRFKVDYVQNWGEYWEISKPEIQNWVKTK